jgi:phage-related protein
MPSTSIREERAESVSGFLDELETAVQDSILAPLGVLRARSIRAREPLARHLEDKLWELRDEVRTNIYRVVYFFFSGRRIVLLHGFQKKTQKTPRREIEVAQERYRRFLRQQGGA